MSQTRHEPFSQAMRSVVRALGGTRKVSTLLRPEKTFAEAERWLGDCLNPGRPEKLSFSQMIWLMSEGRRAGCHDAINCLCAETGYSSPQPMNPEAELVELRRQHEEAKRHSLQLAERIEKISAARCAP